MPTNYRDAVRKSFFAKLAVFLKSEGSRLLSEFPTYTLDNGQLSFTYTNPNSPSDTTEYLLDQKCRGELLSYPGVNIYFLDEVDQSPGRLKHKEYLLGVRIVVCREITGSITPKKIQSEILNIEQKILECLSDGFVEIWDFAVAQNPVWTGYKGHWFWDTSGFRFQDESIAVEGGDIRRTLRLYITFHDFSY